MRFGVDSGFGNYTVKSRIFAVFTIGPECIMFVLCCTCDYLCSFFTPIKKEFFEFFEALKKTQGA